MRLQPHLGLILATGLVLTGAACGNKVAEKATERAIERSTNQDVDVDLDGDRVAMNVNGVAWQAGDSVELPDGFPEDVYIIEGTIKVATTIEESNGYAVTIEANIDVAAATSEYEREVANDGWTIEGSAKFGATTTISAKKAERTMIVGIYDVDGKAQIQLSTRQSE